VEELLITDTQTSLPIFHSIMQRVLKDKAIKLKKIGTDNFIRQSKYALT
jgi:hypothetical protein